MTEAGGLQQNLKIFKRNLLTCQPAITGILQNYYFVTDGQLILSDALKIIV